MIKLVKVEKSDYKYLMAGYKKFKFFRVGDIPLLIDQKFELLRDLTFYNGTEKIINIYTSSKDWMDELVGVFDKNKFHLVRILNKSKDKQEDPLCPPKIDYTNYENPFCPLNRLNYALQIKINSGDCIRLLELIVDLRKFGWRTTWCYSGIKRKIFVVI